MASSSTPPDTPVLPTDITNTDPYDDRTSFLYDIPLEEIDRNRIRWTAKQIVGGHAFLVTLNDSPFKDRRKFRTTSFKLDNHEFALYFNKESSGWGCFLMYLTDIRYWSVNLRVKFTFIDETDKHITTNSYSGYLRHTYSAGSNRHNYGLTNVSVNTLAQRLTIITEVELLDVWNPANPTFCDHKDCNDIIKVPSYLQCGHIFCGKCGPKYSSYLPSTTCDIGCPCTSSSTQVGGCICSKCITY